MKKVEINLADYYENPTGYNAKVKVSLELAKFLKESQSKTAYIEDGRKFKRYNREDIECNLPSLEISIEYLIEECDESLLGGTEWCLSRKPIELIVENKIIAEQAMAVLSDDEIGRLIVWLRYYKEHTETEVGEVLKISHQRVSVKLRQCLKKMKKALIDNNMT